MPKRSASLGSLSASNSMPTSCLPLSCRFPYFPQSCEVCSNSIFVGHFFSAFIACIFVVCPGLSSSSKEGTRDLGCYPLRLIAREWFTAAMAREESLGYFKPAVLAHWCGSTKCPYVPMPHSPPHTHWYKICCCICICIKLYKYVYITDIKVSLQICVSCLCPSVASCTHEHPTAKPTIRDKSMVYQRANSLSFICNVVGRRTAYQEPAPVAVTLCARKLRWFLISAQARLTMTTAALQKTRVCRLLVLDL